jgi:hypothetical protein
VAGAVPLEKPMRNCSCFAHHEYEGCGRLLVALFHDCPREA